MNDEFILNSSLFEVLGGESGSLSPLYDDLKAFMSKVFFVSCVKCEVSLNWMLVIM
jgi:hypothetical protein